ncbi:MAG: anti-sigma factor, partial [Candidatus Eremiobacteraeota bacterium]|nr:anti-sigma factor [Candidatus Eremiobacteraeota bacterium]
EELLDEIASLALGVSEVDAARRLRARVALDDELLAAYQELRATADLLGYAAEAPPGALDDLQRARMKARILRQVRPTGAAPAKPSARARWLPYLVSGLALAAALFAVVNTTTLTNQLNTQRQQTADLFAPDSKHYRVAGGEVITRGDRVYLAMRSLPKLPPGKVFQVWTLARGDKKVAPNVTFTPTEGGSAIISVASVNRPLAAVALSIEPEGGSKAPTTTPTFIRPLS